MNTISSVSFGANPQKGIKLVESSINRVNKQIIMQNRPKAELKEHNIREGIMTMFNSIENLPIFKDLNNLCNLFR